jgi:hypothetical protein
MILDELKKKAKDVCYNGRWLVWFMVFNATFNNISVILAICCDDLLQHHCIITMYCVI